MAYAMQHKMGMQLMWAGCRIAHPGLGATAAAEVPHKLPPQAKRPSRTLRALQPRHV